MKKAEEMKSKIVATLIALTFDVENGLFGETGCGVIEDIGMMPGRYRGCEYACSVGDILEEVRGNLLLGALYSGASMARTKLTEEQRQEISKRYGIMSH